MDRGPKDIAWDRISLCCLAVLLFTSCAPQRSPEETLKTALSYTELEWLPEARHIRHGKDLFGITVHTPDSSLARYGDNRGWWQPGVPTKGMAYKWGGFDTPETYMKGLKQGKKAGDIANSYKIERDDAAVSMGSVGIDCSGFVSRCWGLTKHISTKDLPSISTPIRWDELRAGDILLKKGHVILYSSCQDQFIIGFEAGPIPTWRTRRGAFLIQYLKNSGYTPWRYRYMLPPKPSKNLVPYYDIQFGHSVPFAALD